MSYVAQRTPGQEGAGSTDSAQATKVGAGNLVDAGSVVQTKVGGSTLVEGAAVHQVAAEGITGGGGQLPHLAAIQQSFGSHDVGGIQSHVGGSAQQATGALGTEAYATGNHVAFASTPSLHTAAHEAAHVVQQRAGVQLKGGLSAAGDDHERHADAVADLVVQGKSAEGLLGRYAGGGGGGGGGAVQAKGGDLGTSVLPRFKTAPSQKPTVLESLPASEGRDSDGNDVKKVALENALASWVVTNEARFAEPIKDLSKSISDYLKLREEHIGHDMTTSLTALTPEATTYGRMAGLASYPEQLQALLAGGGSIHEHLIVHQMFVDKIYNQDVRKIIDELSGEFSEVIADPTEKDALKPPQGAVNVGEGTMTYEDGHNNARSAARSMNQVPKVATGGLGPHKPDVHGEGTMIRGTDKFTAVEKNAFTQSARLLFNMPVSGTGLSGLATDVFTCAKLLGLADPTTRAEYALAAFSFFAKAGAHTFHEVMLMAKAAGFSEYVPGNYISAIPERHRDRVRTNLGEHAALLADPAAAAPVVQAADSTLHGWKDVVTLDGDASGWEPKVKAFLATRFAVGPEAVTVTPITDGRSGDMVYKINVVRAVGGPYKGIFKVFNDANMADTEIEIGDAMRAKGVTTPANKGVARVETSDGKSSKAGVLFDGPRATTPHEIVKQIGALDKDAETRAPLVAHAQARGRGDCQGARGAPRQGAEPGGQGRSRASRAGPDGAAKEQMDVSP